MQVESLRRLRRQVRSWWHAAKGTKFGKAGLWIDEADAMVENERAPISEEIRAATREMIETGVTVIRGAVESSLCDAAAAHYASYAEEAIRSSKVPFNEGRYPRLVNLHEESEAFRRLFSRNRALAFVDHAFGRPATVYTSLTFQVGTQQPIHRDIPVFRTQPDRRYFGMWVALEDVDEANGPLMVVRGGHKAAQIDPYALAERMMPRLNRMSNTDLQEKMWGPYQELVLAESLKAGLTVERISVKKGDCVIWHSMLPHGGSPVLDKARTRQSCVFHIVPGHTPVYQADVFFRRDLFASETWRKVYYEYEGREFLKSPPPSFMP